MSHPLSQQIMLALFSKYILKSTTLFTTSTPIFETSDPAALCDSMCDSMCDSVHGVLSTTEVHPGPSIQRLIVAPPCRHD